MILLISRMTSTHWPHKHFELLLSFLAHANNAGFIKSGRVIKPKICIGPGLLVYGLATPLAKDSQLPFS